jgi:hypothetical protein
MTKIIGVSEGRKIHRKFMVIPRKWTLVLAALRTHWTARRL